MDSCEIFETIEAATTTSNIKDIPTVKNEILTENRSEKQVLDILKPNTSKNWFHKFRAAAKISPFSQRNQSQSTRTNSSHSDPTRSTTNGGHRFCFSYIRKINREAIVRYCKKWIKHPMNKALLVWFFFVAACVVVLFLFMAGLLKQAIPDSAVQKKWTEIFNQILNALFTIMCLYQHPRIAHHLVLLCCWRSGDIVKLRNIYCKNGTRKPHERAHMMFAVILLHITCLSQYALCALIWAYTINTRPTWPQALAIVIGTLAPIIAAIYILFGPLAKITEAEHNEVVEEIAMITNSSDENRRVVETSPEWVGGLFECCDDPAVTYLSFFCTFFVFGWNMQRLGFGNMYVHIFTFMLLCIAPVIVFSVTAYKVNDTVIRYMVGITGIVLCMFGLLYGGYWRIEMRKKFILPKNRFCCGYPDFTDFMQWLFCWSCSLAQEVRTGDFYDVEDGSFYRKESNEGNAQVLVPLPKENGAEQMALPSFGSARIHSEVKMDYNLEILRGRRGEIHEAESDEMMRPPLQLVV